MMDLYEELKDVEQKLWECQGTLEAVIDTLINHGRLEEAQEVRRWLARIEEATPLSIRRRTEFTV